LEQRKGITMQTIDWADLIGKEAKFYGVCGKRFKLGSIVFEAVEDANDGYRSCLENFYILDKEECKDDIFFHESIADVMIIESPRIDGIEIVENDHTYLTIGTDTSDNYYPFFVFEYNPRNEKDLLENKEDSIKENPIDFERLKD